MKRSPFVICYLSFVISAGAGHAQSPVGVQEPAWSADGKRVAVSYLDRIWTMTADGKYIVGAVPGAEGFYTTTGCVVGGLSISPGIGEMLAQLILTGASEIPLDLYSVSRFSPDFNEDELIEACVDAYAHHYSEDYAAIAQAG